MVEGPDDLLLPLVGFPLLPEEALFLHLALAARVALVLFPPAEEASERPFLLLLGRLFGDVVAVGGGGAPRQRRGVQGVVQITVSINIFGCVHFWRFSQACVRRIAPPRRMTYGLKIARVCLLVMTSEKRVPDAHREGTFGVVNEAKIHVLALFCLQRLTQKPCFLHA